MNDDDTRQATHRWWLNPALAQLAFGASTRGAQTPPSSAASMMERALLHAGMDGFDVGGLDLDDPAQREFGDYELLELIGRGGMGVVYRARQHGLDREVAIKLLSAGPWASDEFVVGFRREARHAAQLQHPNIVVVHEMGEHAGLVFYAMQLVRGRSLSQLLAAGETLSPRQAATLLRTVAEAVDYAHRLGVLHLDLKPGNLLIDAHGVPLVADFGLARRIEQAIGLDNEHVSGTPSYMAPEQAQVRGAPLTPATDVWGLGAILYELLTGTPPFEAGDPEATLRQLADGEVRKPSLHARVPADIEAICLKCLARDPQQRYPTARALADDLGRYLEGRAVSVRPLNAPQRISRWARREPRLAATAVLAIAALLVGVLATSLQWRRAEDNAAQVGQALRAQRAQALQQAHATGRDFDALPGLVANLQASERGGDKAGSARERLRLGMTFAALPQLVDRFQLPQRIRSLALSPDGKRLAIGTLQTSEVLLFDSASGRELWRVSLAEEPAFLSKPGEPREVNHLRFSPDGRYLIASNVWPTAVISPSGMDNWRIEVANGLLARPQTRLEGFTDATYSADGRHALLRRWRTLEVQLWDARAWKPIGRSAAYDRVNPAWLIAPGASFIARWDGAGGVSILEPRTLAVRHAFPQPDRNAWHSAWDASPDGTWLALGDRRGHVVLIDPMSGGQRRLLPGPTAWVHWLRFSADGSWLVAGSEDGSVWLWTREDAFARGRAIHTGVPVWHVAADARTGLVRVGAADTASVWQMSGLGEADRAAQPRAPLVRQAQQIPRYAADLHAASGLLATASDSGEVRLWRLPATPIRAHVAAPQMTSRLDFDGEHLASVAARDVTVVRADDDRPVSKSFNHPQPVGFAALGADGASLVTSSGRELRVFDWRAGRLRFAPLRLPNSPMKLVLDPRGRHVYASYTVERGRAVTEAVAGYSLIDGRRLAPPVEIAGGLVAMAMTPDGERLLLAGIGSLQLRDAVTLRPAGETWRLADAARSDAPRHQVDREQRPADAEMLAVAVSREPLRIAMATSQAGAGLRTYDVATARWLPTAATIEMPMSVAISPDGALRVVLLPRNRAIELIRDNGMRWRIDAPDGVQFARGSVFSADGRVLAQALTDGVLLLDAGNGEWLAPPLRAPIPLPDVIAQLAFSANGSRLLARTTLGRWLWWRLDPDTRDEAAIASEARLLAPTQSAVALPAGASRQHIDRQPSGESQRVLRQPDRGGAQVAAYRRLAGTCLDPAPPLLPRHPSTPARMLDLAPYAGFNPRTHDLNSPFNYRIGNLCGLPQGVQRFDGVDFDLRAAISRPHSRPPNPANRGQAVSDPPAMTIASRIPVPASITHIAGLDVLATSTTKVVEPPPQAEPVQAHVVLRYADRSQARMPMRYGRDITMWNRSPPPSSHLGWQAQLPDAESGLYTPWVHLFRVRVPNPHPERAVRSIDVETTAVTWNGIAILGITLDPVAAPKRVVARAP